MILGVAYDIDLRLPPGSRIRNLTFKGRPVAVTDSFTLAVNSHRQSGGGGFTMLRTAPVVYDHDENIRDLLIAEVRARGHLDPADYAKVNPGKLSYGYTPAASGHMAMELLKQTARIFMVGIPYRGGGPMMTDMLGGTIPLMFINQDVALQHIKAGKLRALAVTTATRTQALPDVPTLSEFVPGFEASQWIGLVAPKDTPSTIIEKLNGEINAALGDPKMKTRFADLGGMVLPGSPADFGVLIRDETEKWGKVIRAAGIRVD